MTAPGLGLLIEVGLDVLSTTVSKATGLIVAQIGNVVTSVASGDVSEWWQHVGFVSRPKKPVPGKSAAQVVIIKRSDHDAIIASRDDRSAAIYADLADGETAIFASDGSAIIFLRKDGTIEITGGTVKIGDGSAVFLAKASAISDLQTAINGWTPVANDGGAALKTALTTWISTSYGTTKAKGT